MENDNNTVWYVLFEPSAVLETVQTERETSSTTTVDLKWWEFKKINFC